MISILSFEVEFFKSTCVPTFREYSSSVNQYLSHNLGYKQKIQVLRRNQVYFSSANVSSDRTVIVKE